MEESQQKSTTAIESQRRSLGGEGGQRGQAKVNNSGSNRNQQKPDVMKLKSQ